LPASGSETDFAKIEDGIWRNQEKGFAIQLTRDAGRNYDHSTYRFRAGCRQKEIASLKRA